MWKDELWFASDVEEEILIGVSFSEQEDVRRVLFRTVKLAKPRRDEKESHRHGSEKVMASVGDVLGCREPRGQTRRLPYLFQ